MPTNLSEINGAETVVADNGYDTDTIREGIENIDAVPVTPRKKNAKTDIDWNLYKLRHFLENAFARLKHFRWVATRYEKIARNCKSIILLACSVIWLPM